MITLYSFDVHITLARCIRYSEQVNIANIYVSLLPRFTIILQGKPTRSTAKCNKSLDMAQVFKYDKQLFFAAL